MARKKKKSKDKVFNDRPRKIFRHYFGMSELVFSSFFVLFTLAMGIWFVAQKDNYDPGERDISMEVMIAQQVEDHLWEPPLLRWVEPGSMPTEGGGPIFDLGIFPPQTLGGDWTPGSRVEVFDGTNLYEKIDGQETQYKAYGFQFLHFIALESPSKGLDVNIELYDMGSFQNALGIFAAQRSAGSTVQREGNAYFYLTSVGALGIVDKYYFKFTGSEETETITNHAVLVIKSFAEGMDATESTMPAAFDILAARLGVRFQDIEYVKEDVFQYDFASEFWFGKAGPDSDARYYLHESASEEEAVSLFESILEEHEWDYTLVSRDGNNVVMKHEFLKTIFTLNQSGAFVFGVDGAADEAGAAAAVDELAAKLFEDIA